MSSSWSTLTIAMGVKRDPLTNKAYAAYGKVKRQTVNRVTTTNLAAHYMQ